MERWLGLSTAAAVIAFCGFWLYARWHGVAPRTFDRARTATVVVLMILAFLYAMSQIPGL